MASAHDLVAQMTLEEKASLLSGKDSWHTRAVSRLGVESIALADGPCGLRIETDNGAEPSSKPATCFPSASTTACSFDRRLHYDIGKALGEECREEGISVLLGPGVNIKRNPLCGRNFEYFSEDPYLSGELACAWIKGVQSQDVGASLKHFAANNQETRRMTTASVVDERALHEIYLAPFEKAVRKARPWTVMCSYNRLLTSWKGGAGGATTGGGATAGGAAADGSTGGATAGGAKPLYASENAVLLQSWLREGFGFEGAVISDWGAVGDSAKSIGAGLDLQMPGVGDSPVKAICGAVESGALSEEAVDRAAAHVVELACKAQARKPFVYDREEHDRLVYKAELESAVLLKNEGGALPVSKDARIAIIGELADRPRYQGQGSAHVNPLRLVSAMDAIEQSGVAFGYAPGYSLDAADPDQTLIDEACEIARGASLAIVFVGLAETSESEGRDRSSLELPRSQVALVEALSKTGVPTVAVLCCGCVVDMSWEKHVQAILLAGLCGQSGMLAVADLLLGKACPSGHLAESWPYRLEDVPSSQNFPGFEKTVEYRESIYVGYRYFDSAAADVRYPFGYGLSYTSFEYGKPHVSRESIIAGDKVTISIDVTNSGSVAGAEVVQLYISRLGEGPMRAEQELKGFERVFLEPGQKRIVNFNLNNEAFRSYNVGEHRWTIETGEYVCRLGSASRAIRAAARINVVSTDPKLPALPAGAECYGKPTIGFAPDAEQFASLLGQTTPAQTREAGEPFTLDSTIGDLQTTWIGRKIYAKALQEAKDRQGSAFDEGTFAEMMLQTPLRAAPMTNDPRITPRRIEGVLDMANGHALRGLWKIMRR